MSLLSNVYPSSHDSLTTALTDVFLVFELTCLGRVNLVQVTEREGVREGVSEGWRDGWRDGVRDGVREGGRDGGRGE